MKTSTSIPIWVKNLSDQLSTMQSKQKQMLESSGYEETFEQQCVAHWLLWVHLLLKGSNEVLELDWGTDILLK